MDPKLEIKRPDCHHGRRRIIGGNLARYFSKRIYPHPGGGAKSRFMSVISASGMESLCLDVSNEDNCHRVCEGAVEVYNLAADRRHMKLSSGSASSACAASSSAAWWRRPTVPAHASLLSSSCACNTVRISGPKVQALKETDALIRRWRTLGYGWKMMSKFFARNTGLKPWLREDDVAATTFTGLQRFLGRWSRHRQPSAARWWTPWIARTCASKSGGGVARPGVSCISTTVLRGSILITHCDVDRHAHQSGFERTCLHQRPRFQGGENWRREAQARIRIERAAWSRRP